MSGPRFSQMTTARGVHSDEHPETFASRALPPNEPQPHPVFPGDSPRTTGRSDPDSCGVSALPWDPVHTKACVPHSRVGSLSPPGPWSSCSQAPLAPNAKCSRGSSSRCQTPRCGKVVWGSDLSLLWVSIIDVVTLQSVGLPPGGCGVAWIM